MTGSVLWLCLVAATLQPTSASQCVEIADALADFGEVELAIAAYSTAIDLPVVDDPSHAVRGRALVGRANVWLKQNQPDRAIEDFTTALAMSPTNAEARPGQGSIATWRRRWGAFRRPPRDRAQSAGSQDTRP